MNIIGRSERESKMMNGQKINVAQCPTGWAVTGRLKIRTVREKTLPLAFIREIGVH